MIGAARRGPIWIYMRSDNLLSVGVILAAALLVYANSLSNGFVWDDHIMVEGNDFVSEPANLKHLLNWRYYTGTHAVTAGTRPVFLASLLVDRFFWGSNPAGYHLTNVFLHAANSVLVYGLAAALFSAATVPLLSGLLFALHPIGTEAVNAVSFRSDLLAAFFLFSGLWAYLGARRAGKKAAIFLIAGSIFFYGLGLLSKEMAVTLPALVLLVEFYFPDPRQRRLRRGWALAGYALVGASFIGFWAPRFHYRGLWTPPRTQTAGLLPLSVPHKGRVFSASPPAWAELYKDRRVWARTMTHVFADYFRLLVFPRTLSADRAPRLSEGWREPGVLLSGVVLVLLLVSAMFLRGASAPAGFGLAWCFVALLPVSGILPLYNPVAERYLYAVAAGFCWTLAAGLGAVMERRRVLGVGLAGLILTAYAARTFVRNRDWNSDAALFLKASPGEDRSPRTHYIRAMLLRERGQSAPVMAELKEALRLHPGFAEAWLALGLEYARSGKPSAARPCFEKAIAFDPGNPSASFIFAEFLNANGDFERAAELYRGALDLEPGYLEAWVNLGALYRDRGDYARSRACYEKAVVLAGQDPVPFYSYGLLLEKAGELGRAKYFYKEALARNPGYGPARAALGRGKRRD